MLTRQEMFDKAVRGLASQGFKRSVKTGEDPNYYLNGERCVYFDGVFCHCAWGWVDLSLTDETSSVINVGGLARDLPPDYMTFVMDLQRAHDTGKSPDLMKTRLLELANHYKLTIPPNVDLGSAS